MPGPLVGLAARLAARVLAKNKKAREALIKAKPKSLQKGPSPARKAARKNFAAGAVLGAGTGELARRTAEARERARIEKFNRDMEEQERKRRKEKITKPRKRKEILS